MNPTVSVSLLLAVANRCLRERASRALDAKIYYAALGIRDANELDSEFLIEARASGMVLIRTTGLMGWLDAPPSTEDLNWAKTLVPEGVATISNEPPDRLRHRTDGDSYDRPTALARSLVVVAIRRAHWIMVR